MMLSRPDATLLATPTIATFAAFRPFTPSGPGCVHSGLSGMSIFVPTDLTSRPSRFAYTRSAFFSVSRMRLNAVVGSARREWIWMSPRISNSTALSPNVPLHFHAPPSRSRMADKACAPRTECE